ncbi:DUF732 domain-containing protein [Nocardia higoensis]|uniref:DUF732 domain-containing protein n=1 Tax=Nocardia higoensis TaxID=228599 RepID=A0ABS0DJL3_9NOCA|nr:DUF732 domain-containing protein [Nocardia higoensis]MBF6356878.1 DUF732 domain-containing protein [Nocardia higoensis]
MHRIRGKVFGVAVAIAATGLLAACGDDDSTASSTPTLSTTATSSAAASSSAEGEPASPAPESPAPAPEQAEQQPEQQTDTAAPERPQPVPDEQIPEADTSGLSDKDKQYLAALEEKGIKPSSPDIALSVATYVCQGVAAGAAESDLTTFVNAMAGSDAAFDPSKMPVEEAGRIYIDTAKQTYCQ